MSPAPKSIESTHLFSVSEFAKSFLGRRSETAKIIHAFQNHTASCTCWRAVRSLAGGRWAPIFLNPQCLLFETVLPGFLLSSPCLSFPRGCCWLQKSKCLQKQHACFIETVSMLKIRLHLRILPDQDQNTEHLQDCYCPCIICMIAD